MLVGSPSSAHPCGAVGGAPAKARKGSTRRSENDSYAEQEASASTGCTDDYAHKDSSDRVGWPAVSQKSDSANNAEVTSEEGRVYATNPMSHSSCFGSTNIVLPTPSDHGMSASFPPPSCEAPCSAARPHSTSAPVATAESSAGAALSQLKEALPAPNGSPRDNAKRPRPLRFFIGGLPPHAEDQDLHELFSKYGNVLDVRIAKDYVTGRKRGFAFVTMETDGPTDAIFEGVQYIGGKRVDIRRENDITPTDLPRKVFVGGLHPSWAQQDLSRELSRFGEVETVQIATDESGNSRCFGFVTFKHEQVAESLIGQGSCKIGDRFVEIRKPEPRRSRAKNDAWRNQWHWGYPFVNENSWYFYSQQQWQAYYAGFHFHPDMGCWSYWPHFQDQVPSNAVEM